MEVIRLCLSTSFAIFPNAMTVQAELLVTGKGISIHFLLFYPTFPIRLSGNSPEIWISGYKNMSNCSQYKYPWPIFLFRSMVLKICHPRIFLHDRQLYNPLNPFCSEPSYIYRKKGEGFCYEWDNMIKVFYMECKRIIYTRLI